MKPFNVAVAIAIFGAIGAWLGQTGNKHETVRGGPGTSKFITVPPSSES